MRLALLVPFAALLLVAASGESEAADCAAKQGAVSHVCDTFGVANQACLVSKSQLGECAGGAVTDLGESETKKPAKKKADEDDDEDGDGEEDDAKEKAGKKKGGKKTAPAASKKKKVKATKKEDDEEDDEDEDEEKKPVKKKAKKSSLIKSVSRLLIPDRTERKKAIRRAEGKVARKAAPTVTKPTVTKPKQNYWVVKQPKCVQYAFQSGFEDIDYIKGGKRMPGHMRTFLISGEYTGKTGAALAPGSLKGEALKFKCSPRFPVPKHCRQKYVKSLACASSTCMKTAAKHSPRAMECSKGCIDGKYINFGRYEHNTKGIAKKFDAAQLDKDQATNLHRMSSGGLYRALKVFTKITSNLSVMHSVLCECGSSKEETMAEAGKVALLGEGDRAAAGWGRRRRGRRRRRRRNPFKAIERGAKKARKRAERGAKAAARALKRKAEQVAKAAQRKATELKKKARAAAKAAARRLAAALKKRLFKQVTKGMPKKMKSLVRQLVFGGAKKRKIKHILADLLTSRMKSKPLRQLIRKAVRGELKGKNKFVLQLARVILAQYKPWFQQQFDLQDSLCDPLKPTLEPGYTTLISKKWGFGLYAKNEGKSDSEIAKAAKQGETSLFGDAAFELVKREGTTGKVVCAARFDTNVAICSSCCCRNGLVTTASGGVLLSKTLAASSPTGRLFGGTWKTDYPHLDEKGDRGCTTWFTYWDAVIRATNNILASIQVYTFHEHRTPKKGTCDAKGRGKPPMVKGWWTAGGTGCLAQSPKFAPVNSNGMGNEEEDEH